LSGTQPGKAPPVRRAPTLAVLGLLAVSSACGGGDAPTAAELQPPVSARPNIVFILADDLDNQSMPRLAGLQSLLVDRGTTFTRSFVTTPICAPSRASILSGLYAHNHGALTNLSPEGGFDRFTTQGREASTLATWLRASGYRTIFLGKYLNGYPSDTLGYIPPGWDDWHADFSTGVGIDSGNYFEYQFNDNGLVTGYGSRAEDYLTDVLAQKAVEALRSARAARDGKPFFLYLAPPNPHIPAYRAARYQDAFKDELAPRPPSFDEADLSDKPGFLQLFPPFGERDVRRLDFLYQDRLASMLAVEDLVRTVLGELESTGVLDKTYIVLTSDNGFLLGPHRIPRGKGVPYEEAIGVPLVVRGPGVPAGAARDELVTNVDLAPTFAAWADAATPELDGRSLAPLLSGAVPDWREDFLIEYWTNHGDEDSAIPSWTGLRTLDATYVEYASGDTELYDDAGDPYQLENLRGRKVAGQLAALGDRLAALRACRGASCR
jgi:arylsulfatase A-like enzyme